MPQTVDCHVRDGAAFLRRGAGRYDAIILDAFSDEIIPPHLLTDGFFRLAKARLKRGGLFLVNIVVMDDDDPTPDRIARSMGEIWRDVRLLDADGFENRNAVAVGGAVKNLKRPRLLMRPVTGARALAKSLSQLSFRPLR
jgi:spermidine synthase